MDPVLHDIRRDGPGKYLGGLEQTTYNKAGLASSGKYWQLQNNQMEIGWENLIQGKYSNTGESYSIIPPKKDKDPVVCGYFRCLNGVFEKVLSMSY